MQFVECVFILACVLILVYRRETKEFINNLLPKEELKEETNSYEEVTIEEIEKDINNEDIFVKK